MDPKIKGFILALLLIASVASCKKNNNNSNPATQSFTLSKSTVAINEPVVATANSNVYVKWSVKSSPSTTWMSSSSNQSVILFSAAGSYTVTANYYVDSVSTTPYDSSSLPVTVTNGIFSDSSAQTPQCNAIELVPLKSNDQINITPVSYSDTGLVMVVHTNDTYGNYYPLLNYIPNTDSVAGYGDVFGEISQYPCGKASDPQLPGTAIISFGGYNNPLQSGTSDVTFAFNGTLYKGTLTVTSTSCTFSWNYTSGVTISPFTIQKQ